MANLVVRWLVLDRWVPWVVLVFIGGSHGVRGRVYAVEDDEARDVEWPHWAGDHGGVLLSKERHVFWLVMAGQWPVVQFSHSRPI